MPTWIPKDRQAELLEGLQAGDVFECGSLLSLPDAPRMMWTCEEVTDSKGNRCYKLKVDFMGVVIKRVTAVVTNSNSRAANCTPKVRWAPR